jgi:hypothetical protein
VSGTGLSGAVILPAGDKYMVKSGGDGVRTQAQGQWLAKRFEVDCLPNVYRVLADSYIMERLVEPEEVSIRMVVACAEYGLWSEPSRSFLGWNVKGTEKKVLDALRNADAPDDVVARVLDRFTTWHPVKFCTAHGDLTFENIMSRDGRDLVFIDPLPPTELIPEVVGVDVGKLLQSALGWEKAKGETPCPWTVDDVRDALSPNHFKSGTDWVTVHLARILPYAVAVGRDDLREWVFDAIQQSVDL